MGTDAHVCLLLFSSLVALTAEAFPAHLRIMPSPLRKNRPPTLLYPHRKLSRPWLVKLQEELWRDGPSGDGPDEDGWSTLIPSPTSRMGCCASKSAYKTHSPSPEDFLTSQDEPFPTVIDTMSDESSFYGEEFISRTSLPYQGPSSLLNSFIFRPSLPLASSSIKTPTLEDSASNTGYIFPSWTDESSAYWEMSPRRALSETVSDDFVLITAISATHIYGETVWISPTNVTRPRLLTDVLSNYTTENTLETTANISEVPSPTEIITFQTLPTYSEKTQSYTETDAALFTSNLASDIRSIEKFHQTLTSEIFFSSDVGSHLETNFYSNTFSKNTGTSYISTLHSSPALKYSYAFDTTSPSSATHRTLKVDNSFSTEILYEPHVTFYTKTSFKSFLSSNIEVTVTVVEDNSSERYALPTVTVGKTSSTIDSHSVDLRERSSEFVYSHVSPSFTDFTDVVSFISKWPKDGVMSVENIMSREDTRTHLKENPFSNEYAQLFSESEFSVEPSYPVFTQTDTFFPHKISYDGQNSPAELTSLKSEKVSTIIKHVVAPSKSISIGFTEKTLTFTSAEINDKKSWANEIESDKSRSEDSNPTYSGHLKSSYAHDSISFLTSISPTLLSAAVYSEQPYPELLSSARTLRAVNYPMENEMTPTIASVPHIMSTNDESGNEQSVLSEFIDPSTHHVTVRSLNDRSVTDIAESGLNYASGKYDIGDFNLTSAYTLSSSIVARSIPSNIRVEDTFSIEQKNTTGYISSVLENSSLEYESLIFQASSAKWYDSAAASQNASFSTFRPASDVLTSPRDETSSLFPSELHRGLLTPSHFTTSSEIRKESSLNDVILTPLPETMRYHLESSVMYKDSPLEPSSDWSNEKKAENAVLTQIVNSQESLASDGDFRSNLDLSSAYRDIQSTKAFPDLYDEETTREDSLKIANENRETYRSAPGGILIESSIYFPHFSDVTRSEETTIRSDDYAISPTPFIRMKLSGESELFSPKDYLSEHIFHSSNKIETESISTTEIGENDYIQTPNIHWESAKYADYSNTYMESSSVPRLLSKENETLFESFSKISYIPIAVSIDAVSRYFVSETSSISDIVHRTENAEISSHFLSEMQLDAPYISYNSETIKMHSSYWIHPPLSIYSTILNTVPFSPTFEFERSSFSHITASQTEREYTTHKAESRLHSEIYQSLEESASSFPLNIAAESKSEFYHISEKTSIQSVTVNKESPIEKLQSEVVSHYFEDSSAISSVFSVDELDYYRPIIEQTPSQSVTASEISTLLIDPRSVPFSRYIESSMDYLSILTSADKSQMHLHTPGIPDSGKKTVYTESNWTRELKIDSDLNIVASQTDLGHQQSSPSVASDDDASFGYRPEEKLSMPVMVPPSPLPPESEEQTSASEWYSRTYVKESETFTRDTLHEFPHFISAKESDIYSLLELTPSQSTWPEAYFSISLKHTEEIPHSHTPELTTIMLERSSCDNPSCLVVPEAVTHLSVAFTDLVKHRDSFEPISPTKRFDLASEQISFRNVSNQSLFPHSNTTAVYSLKVSEPKSVESDYSTPRSERRSTDSDFPQIKTDEPFDGKPEPTSAHYSDDLKKPDPRRTDSDNPTLGIPYTKSVLINSVSYQLWSPSVPTSVDKLSSTSVATSSSASTGWPKESSSVDYDIEMASVLAISSFFGSNSSRNASSGYENSGISEQDWTKSDVKPTPSLDLTIFKNNNYWILTVLEAPAKGQLPENFIQILEQRLANAYNEAFRHRHPKRDETDVPIVVKILSWKNDLLMGQLNVVYVLERGGMLVLADLASELLNFLRHEQLREYLGLYAILKAKPYHPDETTEVRPVSSTLPVVTIVCSVLGFLLLLFCCFCIYCRCCRPKQADDASPTSSASGSLQRSLAKHGQHNRKHLFQEMTHHLATEIVSHKKIDSPAKDLYIPEKEPPPPGKKLPPLPSDDQAQAIDKAIRMLKILENKDGSSSPSPGERVDDSTLECKKPLPKPKKRKKTKEKNATQSVQEVVKSSYKPLPLPVTGRESSTPEGNRESPDSGTSSRHTSSSQTPGSEKATEEPGSDLSNAELLPPLQDLIAKSKADSEAAAADTQVHLSRVRQRISELLDDAFALANGRKFYGSMRSKKIDPATEMFPRYASLRSQSAAETSLTRHEECSAEEKRRPISEGAQHILGVVTDDGQLITRPPPKLVWDHGGHEESVSDSTKHPEVTEAHNRHVNFFPFQQQSKLRQFSASSVPVIDPSRESQGGDPTGSAMSTINVLREAASEVYLAHSSKIHPAAVDQYDEIDVVSALREGEPVADIIQAIKEELQKFTGSITGTTDHNESNA